MGWMRRAWREMGTRKRKMRRDGQAIVTVSISSSASVVRQFQTGDETSDALGTRRRAFTQSRSSSSSHHPRLLPSLPSSPTVMSEVIASVVASVETVVEQAKDLVVEAVTGEKRKADDEPAAEVAAEEEAAPAAAVVEVKAAEDKVEEAAAVEVRLLPSSPFMHGC
jgi:hypothetical protein